MNSTRFLTSRDYEEAIDFLNLAFGGIDFEGLLPKLYKPSMMRHNLARIEDGRIASVVGIFPLEAEAAGVKLKIAGIGGVSTHSRRRGGGNMTGLMKRAVEIAWEWGCDALCLSGQRQRYEPFGFGPAGVYRVLTVSERNLRGFAADESVTFRQVGAGDAELIEQMRSLYAKQSFVYKRGDFYETVISWKAKPYAVLRGGCFAGYFLYGEHDGDIEELTFSDGSAEGIKETVKGLLNHFRRTINIKVLPYQTDFAETIGAFCDGDRLEYDYMWNILNYGKVIRALISVKLGYSVIPDGSVTINVEGAGAFYIKIKDNTLTFKNAEEAGADITLPADRADRLLFHDPTHSLLEMIPADPVKKACFKNIFPLPLLIRSADRI